MGRFEERNDSNRDLNAGQMLEGARAGLLHYGTGNRRRLNSGMAGEAAMD